MRRAQEATMTELTDSQREMRQRWIDELRDGGRMQGTGVLCEDTEDGRRYCCLGVLADLILEERGEEWRAGRHVRDGTLWLIWGEEVHQTNLPGDVASMVGLPSPAKQSVLTAANDSGSTFAEIADMIERGDV